MDEEKILDSQKETEKVDSEEKQTNTKQTNETNSLLSKQTNKCNILLTLVLSVLLNIAVTTGMLYGYHKYFSPHFYSISVAKFLQDERILFLAGVTTQKQVNNNIKHLAEYLRSSKPNNIIITSDVLIHGGKPVDVSQFLNAADLKKAKEIVVKKYGRLGQYIIDNGISQ